MIKQFIIAFILLTGNTNVFAQITGLVKDAKTSEPLAFAHVIINSSQKGTLTDIDGRFKIPIEGVHSITISYVGYENKTIKLNQLRHVEIKLNSSSNILKEVIVYEGENPALPIIRNAIKNKLLNDPENLPFFSLETYNKFTISAKPNPKDTTREAEFMRQSNIF